MITSLCQDSDSLLLQNFLSDLCFFFYLVFVKSITIHFYVLAKWKNGTSLQIININGGKFGSNFLIFETFRFVELVVAKWRTGKIPWTETKAFFSFSGIVVNKMCFTCRLEKECCGQWSEIGMPLQILFLLTTQPICCLPLLGTELQKGSWMSYFCCIGTKEVLVALFLCFQYM